MWSYCDSDDRKDNLTTSVWIIEDLYEVKNLMTQSIYRGAAACLVGLCLVDMRSRAQQQDLVVLLFEALPIDITV